MTTRETAAADTLARELCHRESRDLKAIAHGGGALLFASAFGNGLSYAFGIFLARTLGAEEFGLYALALTIFNMVSLTVVFGMDMGAMKFVSHHLAEGQRAKARETLIVAASLAFGSGLVAAIGLAWFAHPIAVTLYNKPDLVLSLICFATAIPLGTLTIVLLSTLQAFQNVGYTILIKYLWEPIGKFVLAAIMLWAGFHLLGVLISIVLTFAVSAILSIYAVYRLEFSRSDSFRVWNMREARTLLAYCFPLVISNLFGVVASRSDILILGYWTTAQEVGIYLAAFQTAAIMALVLNAFGTSLGPIMSRAWSQQDRGRISDSYQAVSRLSMMVALPIFCCFILFASDILAIFGSEFSRGSAALMILAAGQVFNTATGSANTVLLMSGHSRLVMTNTVIMGVALLAATATIIPFWGMTGAAIAASTTFILTNLIRVFQVWRLHQVQPYTWEQAKPIAAAAAATGITLILHKSALLLPSPVLGLTLGALYLSGVWLLGISRQDRLVFESLVARGKASLRRGET
jgi:O-antigen/teichoic acid export membrane protein